MWKSTESAIRCFHYGLACKRAYWDISHVRCTTPWWSDLELFDDHQGNVIIDLVTRDVPLHIHDNRLLDGVRWLSPVLAHHLTESLQAVLLTRGVLHFRDPIGVKHHPVARR